jgi:glycosyltransferase involved in cell wall biosynthesis
MVRSFDERTVKTSAVLLTNRHAKKDEPMAEGLAARCPVLTINEDLSPLMDADVLIVWGSGRLQKELSSYPGLTVYVSHTSTEAGRLMNSKAVQSMDYFVAVSQKSADFFPKNTCCTVLHNGVNLRRLEPTGTRKEIRKSWGVGQDDWLVGFVGRPHPDKHPERVAMACQLLPDEYIPVFVGEFDERARQEMIDCCPRSIFLGHVDQIGDVYAGLNTFVLPSDHEAMNLAICEAWAAGVPVVATPVGAVAELEEEFNRQLVARVPVDSKPEQVADAIVKARFGFDSDMVLEIRWIARQHFSAEAMARRWTTFLLSVVKADVL